LVITSLFTFDLLYLEQPARGSAVGHITASVPASPAGGAAAIQQCRTCRTVAWLRRTTPGG